MNASALRTVLRLSLAAALLPVCLCANGATVEAKPGEDLQAKIDALAPGDELVLAEGTHESRNLKVRKQGEEKAPITIRAATGAKVLLQIRTRYGFIVEESRFVRFVGLEIQGERPRGRDAFKFFGVNEDVSIEDCSMHDLGGAGFNCSGIRSGKRLTVRRCHIYRTGGHGEGMYIGHQDGNGAVTDSLFEGNWLHDMGGDQGDGIEINEKSTGNIVRDNVVHDTKYPCILVENTTGGPPTIVERNVCWNARDNTIQINGNAIVRNNIILHGGYAALRLGHPGEGRFLPAPGVGPVKVFNNLIIDGERAVSFAKGLDVIFANNIVDGPTENLPKGKCSHNYWKSEALGEHPVTAAPTHDAEARNFFPGPEAYKDAGWGEDPDVPKDDFNGSPRTGAPDLGPYERTAPENPGWKVAPGFKPLPAKAGANVRP